MMARYQTLPSSCGPAAIRNALDLLGHLRSEDEIRTLVGTTVDGVSAPRMLKALRSLRESCGLMGPLELKDREPAIGMLRLLEALRHGRPVICCVRTVDPWDHWAVAGGVLGDAIVCVDSGDDERVRIRPPESFLSWWRGPDTVRRPYYGILL